MAVFNNRTVEIVESLLEAILFKVPFLYQKVPLIMAFLDDARERFSGMSKKVNSIQNLPLKCPHYLIFPLFYSFFQPPSSGFISLEVLWSTVLFLALCTFLPTIITVMAQSFLREKHKRDLDALREKLREKEGIKGELKGEKVT